MLNTQSKGHTPGRGTAVAGQHLNLQPGRLELQHSLRRIRFEHFIEFKARQPAGTVCEKQLQLLTFRRVVDAAVKR